MTLGQRIKTLRATRKLTQRQLAEKVGLNFSYISKIENDRLEHTPSLPTILKLARTLQVDELELMELANKVPPMLDKIAGNKEAVRFFRRATATIKGPEGWQDLTEYLDRRERQREKGRT